MQRRLGRNRIGGADASRGRTAASGVAIALAAALAVVGCGGNAASLGAGSAAEPARADRAPYDVAIVNGRIVDGSGNAWFYGDVAIRGDRIVRIVRAGGLGDVAARKRIDATGMVVAPGFIDIQGQSGGLFLSGDGRDVGKLTQGVTTEILGEGSTPAPVSEAMLAARGPSSAPSSVAARRFEGPHGFDTWLRAMQAHGISPNVGSFVGAGTIRQYGMGLHMGAASPAVLDSMRGAMRRGMQDGAFGLASALIYPPGTYASTGELIAAARAMSPYGGIYITHMRSEADKLLQGMDEAIQIGREGHVPVEIYHLKAAGKRNWGKETAMIAKIDSARAAGLDVQADMYPYTAGGTGLAACLPPWASADGKLYQNLADSAMRAQIRADVDHPATYWENVCQLATPEGVVLTELKQADNKKWDGHRLSELTTGNGKDWLDTVMDLLVSEHRNVQTIFFLMSEDNVKMQLKEPWMKIGTDADGPDPDSTTAFTHPRSYGTYPRILGRYVRDEHLITLEDAVRKMSGAVADRLLIRDRGLLREGMYADVVIFDPATIIDNSTYEQPNQASTGVREVFVNGVEVVSSGKHTGAKPGRIVRGPGWTAATGTDR
ncbi:MAG: D-aminoacylase [Gemmatimonadota bacterium]|nr:D-aminoacylase [Gemmatimonadota bacterium]